jgi:NAD(P)-dependent dehydrogenase (short-subunit alcohol dehydrogenase family)
VRVNSIDPGSMDTAMHRAAEPEENPAEWARPEDVTEPFLWLMADAASRVSGQRFEAQSFSVPQEV